MSVRIYRSTLTTSPWSDEADGQAHSFEIHIRASLKGNIHTNRIKLANAAIPFFQKTFRRRYGRRIAKGKVRVRYEKEERTHVAPSPEAQVESLELSFKGKIHRAKRFPPTVLELRKPRRPTKAKRRKVRRSTRKPVKRQRRRRRSKR